jgi:hypothetical protein
MQMVRERKKDDLLIICSFYALYAKNAYDSFAFDVTVLTKIRICVKIVVFVTETKFYYSVIQIGKWKYQINRGEDKRDVYSEHLSCLQVLLANGHF